MGFLRRLFGHDNAERPDEASDFDESSMEDVDDNEEGWDEALSYEDAHDIWLSSGMDEDYDFRPTPDLDEGYIPGLQHSRDQSPQELLEEWRAEHPPLTTSRWPNIEDFDESEEYEFWCAECEGYGVIAFEAYWDDELLSFLDDCDLCEGRGFYVLEGEEARESFELGHGLAVY